jgi:two-component system, OmpR family, phosphate regulon sensor histidine kinase PhoR
MTSSAQEFDQASASRDLLREMINSMREGVLVVDNDLCIVAANNAARKLIGGRSEVESSRLEDVLPDEAVRTAFQSALSEGESAETKIEIAYYGDNRVYDLRVAPLNFPGHGNQARVLGIFYDITRLERLERVRQEFLSNVSHELRTPLTSIIAFVETLDDGALEDKENNRRFLAVIRRNAERMHHLIDDVLELSLIEARKISVSPQRVPLFPLVEEAFSALAEKASQRRITLHNEVPQDAEVYADSRRLEQILINLMSNAIKFNRESGSVHVRYDVVSGRSEISVRDTGDGIAREHLPRIFERFYRTDTARSRELGGTGLGLAIVKHLARLHGGEVTVESEIGRGSRFILSLPAK